LDLKIRNSDGRWGSESQPNFVAIGQTDAEIWRFFDVQNGGGLPAWIVVRVFGPPTKSIGDANCCAKLVGIGYLVFEIREFLCSASLA